MGLVAKWIERKLDSDPPKLAIESINPDHETHERDAEEINVVGRVTWATKRL